jgi:predicted dehydrogenase
MIHDIDLILSLVQSPVKSIAANGACVLSEQIDIANAHLSFDNGCVANVTASRVSLKTERKLRIFQHDGYLSLDLQDKKLAHFKKGLKEIKPGIPEILSEEKTLDQGDALLDEIQSFLHTIETQGKPVVSGEAGKQALEIAIKITDIIQSQAS